MLQVKRILPLPSLLLLLLLFMLVPARPAFALAHWTGYCNQGGQVAITNSARSTTQLQQSYPQATLTVYITGSSPLTKATLYSTNTGTPLANPLTCSKLGFFSFYAVNSTVDLTFSGTGIAAPFTWNAVQSTEPFNYISDISPNNSLSSLCSLANSLGYTMIVSQPHLALTTQTLSCSKIEFISAGILQPASGQTITINGVIDAAAIQIFDYSAGGAVSLTGPTQALPQWWGVKGDGSTDNATTLGYALGGSLWLSFQTGVYLSSTSQAISLNGQHIACAGTGYQSNSPASLRFTNAGDALVMGNIANVEIDDCMIQTTNAGAGKLLNVSNGETAGFKFNRLSFFNIGSGAATYGLYANEMESTSIVQPYCFNIAKCISLNGGSNAVDISWPLIAGSGNTGLEVNGSMSVNVWGGTLQGAYTTGLYNIDGASVVKFDGTYFENAIQPHEGVSAGVITLRNVHVGGNSETDDAFLFTASAAPVTIENMTGGTTLASGKCLINYLGNGAATAAGITIRSLSANPSGAGAHSVCIGSSTTGAWTSTIADSNLASAGTAVVLQSVGTGLVTMTGNKIISGAYGIDITGFPEELFAHDNNFISVTSGACNGCTFAKVPPGQWNMLNTIQPFLLTGVQHVAALPGCNAFTEGQSRPVDDSTSATFHAGVGYPTGGGSNHVNAYCAGASAGWLVGG